MKKKVLYFVLCLFILPVMFLFSGCTADKDIEIRVSGEYIQWSYQGENIWHDVIDIASIKSTLGETYKGDTGAQGPQGVQGNKGVDGQQVEFRRTDDYIQWHYVGDETWNNLISVEELKTDTPQDTNPQQLAFYPLDDGTYGVGVGNAKELSSIEIPETYKGKKVTKIIDNGFFDGDRSLKIKSIQIPSSVISIGRCAFQGCHSLTSVTMPNSVTSIGELAFYDCVSLNSLIIPNGITRLEGGTFRGCSSLSLIEIPSSVTSIGVSAFQDCTNLTSITIPSSVEHIVAPAFGGCTSLKKLYISSLEDWLNVTILGYTGHPFASSNGTTELYINNELTTSLTINQNVKDYSFFNCTGLTYITLGSGVKNIGNQSFQNCTGLISVTIGNEVVCIGSYAFHGCNGLTSIIIPKSVVNIGEYAFIHCHGIQIYCELNIKPEGYSSSWNASGGGWNLNVYWYSETQPIESGNYWHYDIDGITPKIWE